MNQKVVFLDVDGTIVNDKGIIPESTQIAIRKAVENGHKLVVCSGRSLFQLPQMLLDLGFSGMVTAAGAQVIADGKEIYHAVIDEEHRKFIVDYMEKNNFVYCFQTDAGVVMNKRSEQQILNIMSDMGITEEHLRQLIGEFFIQEDVWNNEKEEKLIYYDSRLCFYRPRSRKGIQSRPHRQLHVRPGKRIQPVLSRFLYPSRRE